MAVWFLYAQTEFGSGSSLAKQVAQTVDYAPFYRAALVSVAALAAAAACAIAIGALPPRMARTLSVATNHVRERGPARVGTLNKCIDHVAAARRGSCTGGWTKRESAG